MTIKRSSNKAVLGEINYFVFRLNEIEFSGVIIHNMINKSQLLSCFVKKPSLIISRYRYVPELWELFIEKVISHNKSKSANFKIIFLEMQI